MARFFSDGKKGQRRLGPDLDGQAGLSVIAADLRIEGELHSTGVIRIEGTVKGELRVEGQVIVAKGALVEGDIYAKESLIAGVVRGSIEGAERVELHATAQVCGDLTSPKLVVHEGAVVEGRLRVGKPDAPERDSPPVPFRMEKNATPDS